MTRKHLKEMAEAIAGIPDLETRREMASVIGQVCSGLNKRFSWSIWKSACKILLEGEKK